MMDQEATVKFSVLIVDDEVEILQTLEEALKSITPNVFIASNGQEGLRLARLHRPTLIVSDYHMPELNGLEFLKTMHEERLNIPFVWITGFAKGEVQKQAWMHGVYEIIEKPFEISRLHQCIEALLGKNVKAKDFPVLVTKLASHEIDLAIDARNYESLVRLCATKNVSITTLVNQLIEIEIKRAS